MGILKNSIQCSYNILNIFSKQKEVKPKLKEGENEPVTNCNQLKLKAQDDKYYNTDVVDIEGMFRIIESIPSKNAKANKTMACKTWK